MNDIKIKKLEIHYKISMILGWLGIIDIVTRNLVDKANGTDLGYVSILFLYIFKSLFGTKIGVTIAVIISVILGLSVLFLFNAYAIRRKINKLKNPIQKNENETK